MPTLVRQATLLDVLVRRGVLTAAQADEASARCQAQNGNCMRP